MGLEDQVGRLANAIAMHQDVAVTEIIRQRDAALKQAAKEASDGEYYRKRRDDMYEKLSVEKRKSAALRGVITRMKKFQKGSHE